MDPISLLRRTAAYMGLRPTTNLWTLFGEGTINPDQLEEVRKWLQEAIKNELGAKKARKVKVLTPEVGRMAQGMGGVTIVVNGERVAYGGKQTFLEIVEDVARLV